MNTQKGNHSNNNNNNNNNNSNKSVVYMRKNPSDQQSQQQNSKGGKSHEFQQGQNSNSLPYQQATQPSQGQQSQYQKVVQNKQQDKGERSSKLNSVSKDQIPSSNGNNFTIKSRPKTTQIISSEQQMGTSGQIKSKGDTTESERSRNYPQNSDERHDTDQTVTTVDRNSTPFLGIILLNINEKQEETLKNVYFVVINQKEVIIQDHYEFTVSSEEDEQQDMQDHFQVITRKIDFYFNNSKEGFIMSYASKKVKTLLKQFKLTFLEHQINNEAIYLDQILPDKYTLNSSNNSIQFKNLIEDFEINQDTSLKEKTKILSYFNSLYSTNLIQFVLKIVSQGFLITSALSLGWRERNKFQTKLSNYIKVCKAPQSTQQPHIDNNVDSNKQNEITEKDNINNDNIENNEEAQEEGAGDNSCQSTSTNKLEEQQEIVIKQLLAYTYTDDQSIAAAAASSNKENTSADQINKQSEKPISTNNQQKQQTIEEKDNFIPNYPKQPDNNNKNNLNSNELQKVPQQLSNNDISNIQNSNIQQNDSQQLQQQYNSKNPTEIQSITTTESQQLQLPNPNQIIYQNTATIPPQQTQQIGQPVQIQQEQTTVKQDQFDVNSQLEKESEKPQQNTQKQEESDQLLTSTLTPINKQPLENTLLKNNNFQTEISRSNILSENRKLNFNTSNAIGITNGIGDASNSIRNASSSINRDRFNDIEEIDIAKELKIELSQVNHLSEQSKQMKETLSHQLNSQELFLTSFTVQQNKAVDSLRSKQKVLFEFIVNLNQETEQILSHQQFLTQQFEEEFLERNNQYREIILNEIQKQEDKVQNHTKSLETLLNKMQTQEEAKQIEVQQQQIAIQEASRLLLDCSQALLTRNPMSISQIRENVYQHSLMNNSASLNNIQSSSYVLGQSFPNNQGSLPYQRNLYQNMQNNYSDNEQKEKDRYSAYIKNPSQKDSLSSSFHSQRNPLQIIDTAQKSEHPQINNLSNIKPNNSTKIHIENTLTQKEDNSRYQTNGNTNGEVTNGVTKERTQGQQETQNNHQNSCNLSEEISKAQQISQDKQNDTKIQHNVENSGISNPVKEIQQMSNEIKDKSNNSQSNVYKQQELDAFIQNMDTPEPQEEKESLKNPEPQSIVLQVTNSNPLSSIQHHNTNIQQSPLVQNIQSPKIPSEIQNSQNLQNNYLDQSENQRNTKIKSPEQRPLVQRQNSPMKEIVEQQQQNKLEQETLNKSESENSKDILTNFDSEINLKNDIVVDNNQNVTSSSQLNVITNNELIKPSSTEFNSSVLKSTENIPDEPQAKKSKKLMNKKVQPFEINYEIIDELNKNGQIVYQPSEIEQSDQTLFETQQQNFYQNKRYQKEQREKLKNFQYQKQKNTKNNNQFENYSIQYERSNKYRDNFEQNAPTMNISSSDALLDNLQARNEATQFNNRNQYNFHQEQQKLALDNYESQKSEMRNQTVSINNSNPQALANKNLSEFIEDQNKRRNNDSSSNNRQENSSIGYQKSQQQKGAESSTLQNELFGQPKKSIFEGNNFMLAIFQQAQETSKRLEEENLNQISENIISSSNNNNNSNSKKVDVLKSKQFDQMKVIKQRYDNDKSSGKPQQQQSVSSQSDQDEYKNNNSSSSKVLENHQYNPTEEKYVEPNQKTQTEKSTERVDENGETQEECYSITYEEYLKQQKEIKSNKAAQKNVNHRDNDDGGDNSEEMSEDYGQFEDCDSNLEKEYDEFEQQEEDLIQSENVKTDNQLQEDEEPEKNKRDSQDSIRPQRQQQQQQEQVLKQFLKPPSSSCSSKSSLQQEQQDEEEEEQQNYCSPPSSSQQLQSDTSQQQIGELSAALSVGQSQKLNNKDIFKSHQSQALQQQLTSQNIKQSDGGINNFVNDSNPKTYKSNRNKSYERSYSANKNYFPVSESTEYNSNRFNNNNNMNNNSSHNNYHKQNNNFTSNNHQIRSQSSQAHQWKSPSSTCEYIPKNLAAGNKDQQHRKMSESYTASTSNSMNPLISKDQFFSQHRELTSTRIEEEEKLNSSIISRQTEVEYNNIYELIKPKNRMSPKEISSAIKKNTEEALLRLNKWKKEEEDTFIIPNNSNNGNGLNSVIAQINQTVPSSGDVKKKKLHKSTIQMLIILKLTPNLYKTEIIEINCVIVNTDRYQMIEEFKQFVKPNDFRVGGDKENQQQMHKRIKQAQSLEVVFAKLCNFFKPYLDNYKCCILYESEQDPELLYNEFINKMLIPSPAVLDVFYTCIFLTEIYPPSMHTKNTPIKNLFQAMTSLGIKQQVKKKGPGYGRIVEIRIIEKVVTTLLTKGIVVSAKDVRSAFCLDHLEKKIQQFMNLCMYSFEDTYNFLILEFQHGKYDSYNSIGNSAMSVQILTKTKGYSFMHINGFYGFHYDFYRNDQSAFHFFFQSYLNAMKINANSVTLIVQEEDNVLANQVIDLMFPLKKKPQKIVLYKEVQQYIQLNIDQVLQKYSLSFDFEQLFNAVCGQSQQITTPNLFQM